MITKEMKKGSTELLILSLISARSRHGYEIGKMIELRSEGKLQFRIASLYPTLCRLEERGLIAGKWVEKPGERRRRYYTLTAKGKKYLQEQRRVWKEFISALVRVAGVEHA